jgi:hypothetical protein
MGPQNKINFIKNAIRVRNKKDKINDKNFDELVKKYPEIKDKLSIAFNIFNNQQYLISSTELAGTTTILDTKNQEENKNLLKQFYLENTKNSYITILNRNLNSYKNKKYGNCGEYADSLHKNLTENNIENILLFELTHQSNMIKIDNHFFLLDK